VNEPLRVFDGHNDVLFATRETGSITDRPDGGHIDLTRAQTGGFAGGFFAAYAGNDAVAGAADVNLWAGELPAAVPQPIAAREIADQFDRLDQWSKSVDGFETVTTLDQLDACLTGEFIGAVPHIEGAAAIRSDLRNLSSLYDRGLRSVGIVWSRPNQFGHGVPFIHDHSPDTGPGLTEDGISLVSRCGEFGIVIDCAHLNERGFWDVYDTTPHPMVVSHAGAHSVCPATRNLTDEQLTAIAETDGIVGITLSVAHIRPDGRNDVETPIDVFCDHISYVVDHIGIDHVGIGSDFDGATIPNTVGDVTGLKPIFAALRERGYTAEELAAIAQTNWRRVIASTWQ